MAAAQAAQVGAVGRAAAVVRDDVVAVGPADPLPAGGEPAGPVASGDERILCRGGGVGVGRRRPAHQRAAAGGVGVVEAAAADQPGQLVEGGGGQQPPVAVGQRGREVLSITGSAR